MSGKKELSEMIPEPRSDGILAMMSGRIPREATPLPMLS